MVPGAVNSGDALVMAYVSDGSIFASAYGQFRFVAGGQFFAVYVLSASSDSFTVTVPVTPGKSIACVIEDWSGVRFAAAGASASLTPPTVQWSGLAFVVSSFLSSSTGTTFGAAPPGALQYRTSEQNAAAGTI